MELAAAGGDAPHEDVGGGDVDGVTAGGRAERAGVNDDDARAGAPDAGAVGVAGQDEARLRAMTAREGGGEGGGLAPGGENAEDAEGRPHGVGGEPECVFQAVRLGLVALRDLRGDAAEEGQAVVEPVAGRGREGGEAGGDEARNRGGVAAPRDDVVEENVAVRDEDLAVGEVEGVVRGEVGVVIAGENRGGAVDGGEPVAEVGAEPGGVLGARAGAGVEGIAVEDEPGGTVEERAELREAVDAAGPVTVVEVGKDAGERGGHGGGQAVYAGAGGGQQPQTGTAGAECRRAGLVVRSGSVRACGMRVWQFFLGWLWLVAVGRGDPAEELARIHVEVLGGQERIDALTALRASGVVTTGGKRVRFTMIAARPNRLRLETGAEGRTLVQGSDGVGAPWKLDSGVQPLRYVPMAEGEGRVFAADAEFDDPLVAGAARGYGFDYAGEVDAGSRKLVRVLVTRKQKETFSVLVDPETYLIVARVEHRQSAGGRRLEITTRYDDYRPVRGVLLPHRVAVLMEGKVVQVTVIEAVEANPVVTAETFARPLVALPAKE